MSWDYDEWYEANRDERNEKRRQRYANDDEYREKVRQQAAKSRERKRGERVESEPPPLFSPSPSRGWKEVEIPGVGMGYTIGRLAALTGWSKKALRKWEHQGVLPSTTHRSANGERLYTVSQLMDLIELLEQKGLTKDSALEKKQGLTVTDKQWVQFEDGSVSLVELYRVAPLAAILDRSTDVIGRMEKQLKLPATTLRTLSRGQRRYSRAMLEGVARAWEAVGGNVMVLRGKAWDQFYTAVIDQWIDAGWWGARIVGEPDGEN